MESNKNARKKLQIILLTFILCFLFTACGNAEEKDRTSKSVEEKDSSEENGSSDSYPDQAVEEENEEKVENKNKTQNDSKTTEASLSEETNASANKENDSALLHEFINILNYYSDPPTLQGKELEDYYKGEFDSWKSGQGYENIVLDDKGHLTLKNDSDEFEGEWRDTFSQRCNMTIFHDFDGYYYIDIYWGNSAWSSSHWSFIGQYDSDVDGIVYWGSRIEEYYPDNGAKQETFAYNNGQGLIYISDGILYWIDYVENAGVDCTFEKCDY